MNRKDNVFIPEVNIKSGMFPKTEKVSACCYQENHGDLEQFEDVLTLRLFDEILDLFRIVEEFACVIADTVDVEPQDLCLGVHDLLDTVEFLRWSGIK